MSRQLRDEDDYQAVRRMLERLYAVDGPPEYCTIGSLDWWRYTDRDPDHIFRSRIWLDDDEVVGLVWLDDDGRERSRVDHVSHPDHHDLEPAMLRWAECHVRAMGKYTSLTAFAYPSHPWRESQLAKAGFECRDEEYRYWHRTLDDLLVPQTIGDYVIRSLRGDDEVDERVAAHQDAFARSSMSVAKHRAVMTSPTYRQDLDLVVVAPDGTIAAFCIVWLDEANARGQFEPVGCRAAHQQRGLAKAVLFEGMRRLHSFGARTVCVASDATNIPANRLYASAGFASLDVVRAWVKPLS